MKSAIFLDFKPPESWRFIKDLEKKTGRKYDCVFMDSHNQQGKKRALRYLSYVFMPLKYVEENQYDLIIAWQQFYGLFFAFWSRLLKRKKTTKLIIMTFIYKKKAGFKGIIYDALMRYILGGGYIDKFICFSEEECKKYSSYFHIDRRKFSSCKLEVEDACFMDSGNIEGEEEFYLTAGRSNRDYKYICEAFRKMPLRKLIIICDSEQIENLPENIEWKNNVHGTEYMNYLSRCRAVIVPLNISCGDISAGQLVIIQGMMFSKIVIATKTTTTEEYINDQRNGLLINNNYEELSKTLDAIEYGKYNYIKNAARRYYKANYSGSNMAESIANALNEIERGKI